MSQNKKRVPRRKVHQPERVIVYDFESNGYFSYLNQPIEIYMKIMDKGKEPRIYHAYIKTKYKLNSAIIDKTGITDEILEEKGRDIKAVFKEVAEILFEVEDTLLVGFYSIKFDNKFLDSSLTSCWDDSWDKKLKLKWDSEKVYDCAAQLKAELMGWTKKPEETLVQFHRRCISAKCPHHHRLEDALAYYGIEHNGKFHSAGEDAEKTALIYAHQIKNPIKEIEVPKVPRGTIK